MRRNSIQGKQSRSGVILVAVLVCMGVATAILLGTVQKSLRCRQQLRTETKLEQTRWLVDAGLRKAIANLEKHPDYSGERFVLPSGVSAFASAQVEIKVQRIEASPDQVGVVVTAELGSKDDDVLKVQRTKELVLDVPLNQE